MSRTILVTGASGFIGQHTVARLLSAGNVIRTLSRAESPGLNAGQPVQRFRGSYLDESVVERALAGVEVLVHLAATTTPGASHRAARFDLETNVLGTVALVERAIDAGVRRMVFVSSGGAVYGGDEQSPSDERAITRPISAYGIGKLAIEHYLRLYRKEYGLEIRIVRGGNPFGEHQAPERGQGFVSTSMWKMLNGEPVTIWGDGTSARDFFYVGDLADALSLMVDDGGRHEIYNVGSGTTRTVNQMIRMIEEVTGLTAEVRYERGRSVDVPYSCLDISRANAELGWSPQVALEEGLMRTWQWIQTL